MLLPLMDGSWWTNTPRFCGISMEGHQPCSTCSEDSPEGWSFSYRQWQFNQKHIPHWLPSSPHLLPHFPASWDQLPINYPQSNPCLRETLGNANQDTDTHTHTHAYIYTQHVPARTSVHTHFHPCPCTHGHSPHKHRYCLHTLAYAHTHSTSACWGDAGNVVAPPSPACAGVSSCPAGWVPSSGQHALQSRSCSPCLLPSPPGRCSMPGDKREAAQRCPMFNPGLALHGPHPPPTLSSKLRLCRENTVSSNRAP